jgi:hypothetical protein
MFFFLQLTENAFSDVIILSVATVLAIIGSVFLKKYYKTLIVLIFIISVFNMKPIVGAAYKYMTCNDEWKKQPDDIESVKFKQHPNIYYIQPDGYTSFSNLRNNSLYHFDNSGYEKFLKEYGFVLYDDYRSNYSSTLLSNSATFNMKHHYIQKDVDFYGAGSAIMDNAVLRIFKKNGYKTSFITQAPYLIINRPDLKYDYCNFNYNELPYFGDGRNMEKNVFSDLKEQMSLNRDSGNFYFIENFSPGHVSTYQVQSLGEQAEIDGHMKGLAKAELWLKATVSYIIKEDPNALIIIGADHGGFAGFTYAQEALNKIADKEHIYSIFGAQLAIKWNADVEDYDDNLKSGVNLFRILFSYLSKKKTYLNNLQDDGSYKLLKDPKGVYRYINDNEEIVFEKV